MGIILLNKQSDLYLYDDVSNITGYLQNPITIYNEYTELMRGYEMLGEDITSYIEEQNIDSSKKFSPISNP